MIRFGLGLGIGWAAGVLTAFAFEAWLKTPWPV